MPTETSTFIQDQPLLVTYDSGTITTTTVDPNTTFYIDANSIIDSIDTTGGSIVVKWTGPMIDETPFTIPKIYKNKEQMTLFDLEKYDL